MISYFCQLKRYALRYDESERIKDLLPGRVCTVGITAKDNRLFVEAVLYGLQGVYKIGGYSVSIYTKWR